MKLNKNNMKLEEIKKTIIDNKLEKKIIKFEAHIHKFFCCGLRDNHIWLISENSVQKNLTVKFLEGQDFISHIDSNPNIDILEYHSLKISSFDEKEKVFILTLIKNN